MRKERIVFFDCIEMIGVEIIGDCTLFMDIVDDRLVSQVF